MTTADPQSGSLSKTPSLDKKIKVQKERIKEKIKYVRPDGWLSITGVMEESKYNKMKDELVRFVSESPRGFDGDVNKAWAAFRQTIIQKWVAGLTETPAASESLEGSNGDAKKAWMAMLREQKKKIKDDFSTLHLVSYGLLTNVWDWPAIEKIKQDFFDYVDQAPSQSWNSCWKDAWNDFYKNNNEKIKSMKQETIEQLEKQNKLKKQNKDFIQYRPDADYIPRYKKTIMLPQEKDFFNLLLKALPDKLIFPQVSAMAIISHGQKMEKMGWVIKTFECDNSGANFYCNRYNMIRTDYIICDSDLKIESLIELDGRYHDDPDTKNKDLRRDFMMYKAGFTTIRIPCTYPPEGKKLKIYRDSTKKEEIKTDEDLRSLVLDFVPTEDEIAGIQTVYHQKRLPAIS